MISSPAPQADKGNDENEAGRTETIDVRKPETNQTQPEIEQEATSACEVAKAAARRL